ncbi:MAG: EAL domain-containing protein [Rhodocyclaceae bacterium]
MSATTVALGQGVPPLPRAADGLTGELTLAVFANRSKHESQSRWQPLADELSVRLAPARVRLLPLTQAEMEGALRRNEVDLLLTNPTHYIVLRQVFPLSGALATVVEEEGGIPTSVLGGVIFVRAERNDLRELRDLRGKRVASLGPRHLGGMMAPALELARAGLRVGEDVRLLAPRIYHDEVVEAVLSGEADAGMMRTGILEAMQREGRLAPDALRVLNRQTLPGYPYATSTRLYPEWPLVVLPHVDRALVGRIAAAVLSLEPDNPGLRAAGIHGFTIPADYLPVEEVMRELRAPPFDRPPVMSLDELWQRHAFEIGLVAMVLAATLAGLLALMLSRRRLLASQAALRAGEERLEMVLNGTDVGLWDWDLRSGTIVLNERWADMLGGVLADYVPMTATRVRPLVHPDDLPVLDAALKAHFSGDASHFQCELRMRHRDGHWVWVESRAKVSAWTPEGEPLRMAGTHMDISARKHAEERLSLAASVFAVANEGVVVTDHNTLILDVNEAFSRITGYAREEVVGRSPRMLSSGRHGDAFFRAMWASLGSTGSWRGEIWNRKKNGEVYPEHLSIRAVCDGEGRVTHYVAVLSDISHIKAHEQELKRLAHYDPLTGLPNRRLLGDRIQQAMAQSRRHGHMMALAVLDLDGFKPINDTLGHEAGDRVLKGVAQRLSGCLRGGDTAARLGGDEFVLVLLNIHSLLECEQSFERILQALASPLALDTGGQVVVSASLGATLFPDDDADPDTLLRHADQAMYVAKQEGRNRFHVFDAERDREVQSLRVELERLSRALRNHEFLLHYQPKVDMRSGEVLGAEALVRWQHPVKGLLAPAEFLPLLANTEQELHLGEWVIEAALTQMRTWRAEGFEMPLSVNLSVRHFMQPDFARRLAERLAHYPDIPPSALEFEILESAAVDDWEFAAQILNDCRALGVSFALDDFGTGYSSLVQLRRLNAQTLKIDQNFVRDMLDDPDDLIIVESVIKLSESFQRRVVAEGVETEAHAAALIALGCTVGQGYGIARPMPPGQLSQWMFDWSRNGFWRGTGARGGMRVAG